MTPADKQALGILGGDQAPTAITQLGSRSRNLLEMKEKAPLPPGF